MTALLKRFVHWLREPLVHFLAIGAFLFLVFHFRGDSGGGSSRIVITPGQVESMTVRFIRTWQRPPTEAELKGLIDDHVRGEMAAREALALGLDQGDTIIRRRLRQKIEFLAEDLNSAPPTDAELENWLEAHPTSFRTEARLAFRQVYFDAEQHSVILEGKAQKILDRLNAVGPEADTASLGDPLMLPDRLPLTAASGISRVFGQEFAEALLALEPGRWGGPVRSGYGLHLVYIEQREPARIPELSEVRTVVERELLLDRRKKALEAMYERLLERYQVTIEMSENDRGDEVAAIDSPPGDRP